MNLIKDISPILSATERMPLLFVGHGNPMNAIEENQFIKEFRHIAEIIPNPTDINLYICSLAHKRTKVTAMELPRTIHDFDFIYSGLET